jgi:hypothetical protein
MGLKMRKSFTLCKGIKLNVGKRGVGVSIGTKGLKYSMNTSGRKTATIGIPGTGLSYSTTLGSKNKRQQKEKLKQKLVELQKNTLDVDGYNGLIETIKGVHRECNTNVDWLQVNAIKAPYNPPDIGPNKAKALREYEAFSPSLLERIFRTLGENRKKKLEEAIAACDIIDTEEYDQWQKLNTLSSRIIQGDVDAYDQAINESNLLDDLLDYVSDFKFSFKDGLSLEVEFRVNTDTVVPKYAVSLTKTGKLSKKDLSKTEYYKLLQDYVCSCTIRIAREIFALLPVEKVAVHVFEYGLNTAIGLEEAVTVLSVLFDKSTFTALNFELIDPSDSIQSFNCNMKFLKTGGLKSVGRITL